MAKSRTAQNSVENRFKEPGATFSVPLADGRFGACRVLRAEPEKDGGMSLFAATRYVGAKSPDITEPLLASILVMESVGYDKAQRIIGDAHPCVCWQRWMAPPPPSFQYLGVVQPAPAEVRMNPDAYSKFWDNWAKCIRQEWRWQNDREAFIADLDRIYGAGWVKRVRDEKKRLADMTLAKLRKKRFFPDWDEFVPTRVLRDSRTIVKETIDGLILLGTNPPTKAALPLLKQYFESFNALGHSFDTIEREQICEAFFELVCVGGVKGCDALAELLD